MWANPSLSPSSKTRAGIAGQAYQWQSLAWQTLSSLWPLETAHELTHLHPAGGGEREKINQNPELGKDMAQRWNHCPAKDINNRHLYRELKLEMRNKQAKKKVNQVNLLL